MWQRTRYNLVEYNKSYVRFFDKSSTFFFSTDSSVEEFFLDLGCVFFFVMPPKWLVSYPLNSSEVPERSKGESDRDYAKKLVQNHCFSDAIKIYTHLLHSQHNDKAVLHTNRSICHFKLGNFVSSAHDAERAILFDPSSVKAYYRLGSALLELGNYRKSREAVNLGLSLEENNLGLLRMYDALREKKDDPLNVIYGSLLLGDDCPARFLPVNIWRRIFGFCRSMSATLKLTCSLFHSVAWSLEEPDQTVHAAKKFRIAHRLPHLSSLTFLLRYSKIEEDWNEVVSQVFNGKTAVERFPKLQQLKIKPTITGLTKKEIKFLAKLTIHDEDDDAFYDQDEIERSLGCPGARLNLQVLGRVPKRCILFLENMMLPLEMCHGFYGVRVYGDCHRYEDEHFRVLSKTNIMYFKLHALRRSEKWDNFGISKKVYGYFPPTLEHLSMKGTSGLHFPDADLPKGLTYISVRDVNFKEPNLKHLPPQLHTLKLDLTEEPIPEDFRKESSYKVEKFPHQAFNLISPPKRLSLFVLKKPTEAQQKPGFVILNKDLLPSSCTYIEH